MLENKIRCLSLWQPFADGCIHGDKRIETRGRNINVRGTVYIHATNFKALPKEVYQNIYQAKYHDNGFYENWLYLSYSGIGEFGVILGCVDFLNCVPIEKLYGTKYDTPLERAYGDWSEGRFGIIMGNPKRLKTPVKATGHQGFWYANESILTPSNPLH